MTTPIPSISDDARRWLAPALAAGLRRVENTALPTPPASLVLARAILRGYERDLLEAEMEEWGPFGVDADVTTVLAGQCEAWLGPHPPSTLGDAPVEACALDALQRDMRGADETTAVDPMVAGLLFHLLRPLTTSRSALAVLFDAALAAAGERPSLADARVLASVGAAAHLWTCQPVEPYDAMEW